MEKSETSILTTILNIRNKNYLNMLKKLSIYYKYGKVEGDNFISKGNIDFIEIEDIARFVYEYVLIQNILLNYFITNGLSCQSRIIEFAPSSLLSFQNVSDLTNITSIINYKMDSDEYRKYYVGTLKRSGLNIQDNFSYDLSDYDMVLNNSIIDILKRFNHEHDFITDVHGIKFAEDNKLDFFSGYAIKNSSPLKEYIVKDFIRSVEKTKVPCDCVVFETFDEYTLGMVKRNKEEF